MAYSLIDTSGATPTGSSTYLTYVAANAFDGNTGTWYWQPFNASDGTGWLKIDFGSGNAETCTKIRLSHADATTISGNVQGSNNGSDWTTLTSFTHGSVDTFYEEVFANTTAYRYYRIQITGGSAAWIKFNEWELYETSSLVKDIIGTGILAFAR